MKETLIAEICRGRQQNKHQAVKIAFKNLIKMNKRRKHRANALPIPRHTFFSSRRNQERHHFKTWIFCRSHRRGDPASPYFVNSGYIFAPATSANDSEISSDATTDDSMSMTDSSV